MIKEAKEFAHEKHSEQKRKTGEPYISHPERVARLVKKYKKSHKIDELVSAAWLHDTLEDTDTTEEDLKKLFGPLVSSLVKGLTSDKEEIEKSGKKNYLKEKMINMSNWALVIKLADRLDNLSDEYLFYNPLFRKRYVSETKFILDGLEKERKLSKTQEKLVKAIRKKLKELE